MVGAAGFELATPCAQGRCATRLRYAPTNQTFVGAYNQNSRESKLLLAGMENPVKNLVICV
jgi:hypothetical protein